MPDWDSAPPLDSRWFFLTLESVQFGGIHTWKGLDLILCYVYSKISDLLCIDFVAELAVMGESEPGNSAISWLDLSLQQPS